MAPTRAVPGLFCVNMLSSFDINARRVGESDMKSIVGASVLVNLFPIVEKVFRGV